MNLRIEKLVYGGEGLGHHDGKTIFVPYVLPEEVVEVQAVERKKKFVRARVQQLVMPSPERTAAPCPHFSVCGGCHYQHIPYEAQLNYKAQILRETLSRLGKIEWTGPISTHASPPFAYRNRAQWKVRASGDDASRPGIGYFQAASTALCAVDQCPVLSPRLAEILAALRHLLANGRLPAALREVEAFADAADQGILLNASFERFDFAPSELAQTLSEAMPAAETILLHEVRRDRFELFGPGFIRYEAGGNRYRVGHLSFFQVNRFLVDELVRAVVAEESGLLGLDLFAGVGLFTLPLAQRFERVVGVDSNLAAIRDLEANIQESGLQARSANEEAEGFLARLSEAPDLVVLDPPRGGVAPGALVRLAPIAPARITYLSCDPATLARDLSLLTGTAERPGGYDIAEVHLFDVFPQTYHIEALVRLWRRE